MDIFQTICMIIAHAGDSKSCFIESMEEARHGNFQTAEELLEKGKSSLTIAHNEHSKLITSEARGEKVDISLLLVHASSLFTGAEVSQYLAEQFIELCKEVRK